MGVAEQGQKCEATTFYKKAKETWEQSLFLLPSDGMVEQNLPGWCM